MKRFLIVTVIVLFGLSSCWADGKKEVVTAQDIPAAGQQTLATCFAASKVSVALKETELFEVEYEVRFEDGSEIVFDSDGLWKKVDCRKSAVPEQLIPAEILKKVQASFPGIAIVEIEKDGLGYDVELGNDLDLNFDKKFRMRID